MCIRDRLINPENATGHKLREVFAIVGDSGGKSLLVFSDMTSLINQDMHLKDGALNPDKFAPLTHALTLSKLSLLDRPNSRKLIYKLGGDPGLIPSGPIDRYSILFEMLRSIDGNHQWQPYGLHYPRSNGVHVPSAPHERHFGYGIVDGTPIGMPHFSTKKMRRRVFSRLFPERVSGNLANEISVATDNYPFPECASNPFPVAFEQDGSAKKEDLRCLEDAGSNSRNLEDRIIGFWRRIKLAVGLNPKFSDEQTTIQD